MIKYDDFIVQYQMSTYKLSKEFNLQTLETTSPWLSFQHSTLRQWIIGNKELRLSDTQDITFKTIPMVMRVQPSAQQSCVGGGKKEHFVLKRLKSSLLSIKHFIRPQLREDQLTALAIMHSLFFSQTPWTSQADGNLIDARNSSSFLVVPFYQFGEPFESCFKSLASDFYRDQRRP